MDMGPMGVYRIFDEGDHKPLGAGGMMTKPPQIPNSHWSFYFNVDSINSAIERVKAGGGWIIQGHDPLGAMFSLLSSNNKEPFY